MRQKPRFQKLPVLRASSIQAKCSDDDQKADNIDTLSIFRSHASADGFLFFLLISMQHKMMI